MIGELLAGHFRFFLIRFEARHKRRAHFIDARLGRGIEIESIERCIEHAQFQHRLRLLGTALLLGVALKLLIGLERFIRDLRACEHTIILRWRLSPRRCRHQ